ncbi:hypothetical protein A2961_03175 [Candidatus Woesebacteria bacterium RIFCSPLOWO2_01_FULL_39_21]|uniref:Uncharacterized protein n=1 Tax=Candidatus Woesebacteria bacterium RIFCSPLOWO2_01_FULL_39_21 TaxID=1802519 RepID=A0A1F8BHK1_9BACT|nr:MAG: hypothetical protein A2691_02625 [Candidatus Woesebacteria bacterium RIFCSPHIGHO2_01_FULL_39_23]OGM63440.1 MAG: hypothetical protein A2961_03175 [Candidatus Woesebacteria bacterium RIFCSPLOWO2_01_FULL_39_21]
MSSKYVQFVFPQFPKRSLGGKHGSEFIDSLKKLLPKKAKTSLFLPFPKNSSTPVFQESPTTAEISPAIISSELGYVQVSVGLDKNDLFGRVFSVRDGVSDGLHRLNFYLIFSFNDIVHYSSQTNPRFFDKGGMSPLRINPPVREYAVISDKVNNKDYHFPPVPGLAEFSDSTFDAEAYSLEYMDARYGTSSIMHETIKSGLYCLTVELDFSPKSQLLAYSKQFEEILIPLFGDDYVLVPKPPQSEFSKITP